MTPLELAPSCPACGGSESRAVATAADIRREIETLWAFHDRRLRPATPPERLADRVAFSQDPPLHVVRCQSCGLVYRNPRERAHELVARYADEALDAAALEALHENQRRAYVAPARRLRRALGRAGTVLEVGSYVGGFLAAAAATGWRATGLDVNAAVNDFARAKGLAVRNGNLSSLDEEQRFDAVAMWNCFDQLPDPRAAARAARAHLAPGGVLAVRVPNGGFYALVRRRLDGPGAAVARELLAQNNLLGFPYRHGFTPRALMRLLEAEGFAVLRVVGDALVPLADEWTRAWARWEEAAVKAVLRGVGRLDPARAPWFELYARARGD